MAITNFTGAALDAGLSAIDLRTAQSTAVGGGLFAGRLGLNTLDAAGGNFPLGAFSAQDLSSQLLSSNFSLGTSWNDLLQSSGGLADAFSSAAPLADSLSLSSAFGSGLSQAGAGSLSLSSAFASALPQTGSGFLSGSLSLSSAFSSALPDAGSGSLAAAFASAAPNSSSGGYGTLAPAPSSSYGAPGPSTPPHCC